MDGLRYHEQKLQHFPKTITMIKGEKFDSSSPIEIADPDATYEIYIENSSAE